MCKRIIALLLVLTMAVSLTSCMGELDIFDKLQQMFAPSPDEGGEEPGDEVGDYDWSKTTLNVELSEHTCSGELVSGARRYLAGGDPAANDPIDKAIRDRNKAAEAYTKTKINYSYLPDEPAYGWGKNMTRISKETMSYSDTGTDIYVNFMYDMIAASLSGDFANLNSVTFEGNERENYFRFTKEDYNPLTNDEGYMYDLMTSMSLSTRKMYVLASDYLADVSRAFFVVPVNMEMIDDIRIKYVKEYDYDGNGKFDAEDFFNIIWSNEWNFEAVKALSAAVAKQVGETPDLMEDTHGFALGSTISGIHGSAILYGSGIEIAQRHLNEITGFYDVSYPMDAGAFGDFCNALADLFSADGVTNVNEGSLTDTPSMKIAKLFADDHILLGGIICAGNLEQSEYQDMISKGDGFGVAPVPVYRAFDESLDIDENGVTEYYHTAVYNGAKCAAIAYRTTKFEQCTAWLDYQTANSADVMEEYWDKVVGNLEDNVKVINMLRANVCTVFEKSFEDQIRARANAYDMRWDSLIRMGKTWIHDESDIRTYYGSAVEIKWSVINYIERDFERLDDRED